MPFWMGWVGAQQHRPNHLHLKNVQNHHVVLPAPEALTCHARADTYRPLRGEMWVAVLLATWQQRITSPHMHSLLFENASILIDSDGPGRHSIDDHLSSETRRHRRGLKNQSLKLKRRFHEPDASRKRQTPFGWLITNRHRP